MILTAPSGCTTKLSSQLQTGARRRSRVAPEIKLVPRAAPVPLAPLGCDACRALTRR